MKWLRRIHLVLGVFFAPLLVFFLLTGWYQTVAQQRNKTEGEIGDWRSRLTQVHVDSIYPVENPDVAYSPRLFQALVVAMSVAMLATTILGLVLAFKTFRPRWMIWVSLLVGTGVPILLLWLGQKRL